MFDVIEFAMPAATYFYKFMLPHSGDLGVVVCGIGSGQRRLGVAAPPFGHGPRGSWPHHITYPNLEDGALQGALPGLAAYVAALYFKATDNASVAFVLFSTSSFMLAFPELGADLYALYRWTGASFQGGHEDAIQGLCSQGAKKRDTTRERRESSPTSARISTSWP